MNTKRSHLFTILLLILVLAFALPFFIRSGHAMRSRAEVFLSDPQYLPLMINKYSQSLFGITLYSFNDAGGFVQAAQAGISWSRTGISWSAIEPNPTERNWQSQAAVEQDLINASIWGIQPVLLIDSTPEWALKEDYICGAVADSQFSVLGNFAYDLVQRYSAPPYNVHYWELWNEPDVAGELGCWGDPLDTQYFGGGYYGQMLKAVYPRIKEADPSAQVLVGGLLLDCDPIDRPPDKDCLPSKFLEGILAGGAGRDFDGVSFHAYDFYVGKGTYENANWHSSSSTTGPVSIAKANYLKSVLSSYGYSDKYLMNTETAVFWGANVLTPPCLAPDSDQPNIEVTKVNYVVESYAVAVAEGWKANIWYSAFGVRCSGLLNADLTPKNSYYAFLFTRQKLSAAVPVRAIDDYPGMMGYEYDIPGRRLWVVWSLDGEAHTIPLPGGLIEMNRMGEDGRAVLESNNATLTIGQLDLSPRFIEFVK